MKAFARWKIVFALIAIFVAGAVTGGLTALRLARFSKYETLRQAPRENDSRRRSGKIRFSSDHFVLHAATL
jgi:hypothetical protein